MARVRIRYFALVGDDAHGTAAPRGLFREVLYDSGYFLEHLDPKDPNRWIQDMDLADYVIKQDPGAEEISEQAARTYVERKGGKLRPPQMP